MRILIIGLLVGCGGKEKESPGSGDSDTDTDGDTDGDTDADTDVPVTYLVEETAQAAVATQGSGPNWAVASDDGGFFFSARGEPVRIHKVSPSGQVSDSWYEFTYILPGVEAYGPHHTAMAAAPGGGLYVGYVGGSFGGWVIEHVLEGGSVDWSVELVYGDEAYVSDLAVGPDGYLYALGAPETNACRLTRLSADGDPDDSFQVDLDAFPAGSELTVCSALGFGPDGSIYVAGSAPPRVPTVRKLDPEGQLVVGNWEMGTWMTDDWYLSASYVLPGNLNVHDGMLYALFEGRGSTGPYNEPDFVVGSMLVASPEEGGALSGQVTDPRSLGIGRIDDVFGVMSIEEADFATDRPPRFDLTTALGGPSVAGTELSRHPGSLTLDPFQVLSGTPGAAWLIWPSTGGVAFGARVEITEE